MWLYNRRKLLLAGAAAGLFTGLASCGFTPVYGPNGGGNKLQNTILVDEPSNRDSYLLVQQLEHRLGRASTPRYGLSIALKTSQERMAISANNITTRFNVVGRATYALRDLDGGKILTTGTVNSFTGYSATGTTVATQSANTDARKRLMTILADQITTRLMIAAPDLPAPDLPAIPE